jgi:hypothetical protein
MTVAVSLSLSLIVIVSISNPTQYKVNSGILFERKDAIFLNEQKKLLLSPTIQGYATDICGQSPSENLKIYESTGNGLIKIIHSNININQATCITKAIIDRYSIAQKDAEEKDRIRYSSVIEYVEKVNGIDFTFWNIFVLISFCIIIGISVVYAYEKYRRDRREFKEGNNNARA